MSNSRSCKINVITYERLLVKPSIYLQNRGELGKRITNEPGAEGELFIIVSVTNKREQVISMFHNDNWDRNTQFG